MSADEPRRRRVSLADVARAAHVSVSAASFALNGRSGVSEPVRDRVRQAALDLNYTPWTSAVALRTGRSGAVALLIRNMRNPFFLDVINGFDATCAKAGLAVIIGSADYSPERESQLISTFIAREADGLALAPIGGGTAAERWQEATGKPLVLINAARHAPGLAASRVHVDSEEAVRLTVQHLWQLGHRRIALVSAPHERSADDERVETFLELVTTLGFDGEVLETRMQLAPATTVVTEALRRPRGERPTAFITSSDYIASAVYSAAAATGLIVGVDFSVVGHDDLSTSALLNPALSTVAVDRFQIGVDAAVTLIEQLGGAAPRTVVMPPQLVPRSSSSLIATSTPAL